MAAVGVENPALNAILTSSLQSTNVPGLKSSEQTSTEQLASELEAPEQESPGQKLPEQNGGLLKTDLIESEGQTDKPAQENGGTTPSERGEHDDADASGEDALEDEEEEAEEEPALKKQKTEEETPVAVNGEKKRGRGRPPKAGGLPKADAPPRAGAPRKAGRPRKAGGPTAKAKAAPAAPVNGEKRKRGRPRKGEEINPKPARKDRVPPSPVVGTIGSRTRSRATG